MTTPRRLIETDLPIRRISEFSRAEKAIRHGHISNLHLWWARRPLAACRAVLCATLWPDPMDEATSQDFVDEATAILDRFLEGLPSKPVRLLPPKDPQLSSRQRLQHRLLAYIGEVGAWELSGDTHYLDTTQRLTLAAHRACGGLADSRPLVTDPFGGGGAIPLEALRVGAEAFGSDLNPVAVLLNRVNLEILPKHGRGLAEEVRTWGDWVKQRAEKELRRFYPKDSDGAEPIAYLWARTIRCEGPGCGCEVPMIRSTWLAKKSDNKSAVRITGNARLKKVDLELVAQKASVEDAKGTIQRGAVTCPVCGHTTPVNAVKRQLAQRKGGAIDARLMAVATLSPTQRGRVYRLATQADLAPVSKARELAAQLGEAAPGEPLPPKGALGFRVQPYGMTEWKDLFTPRQLMALTTFVRHIRDIPAHYEGDPERATAVMVMLSMALAKQADLGNSLNRWEPIAQCPRQLFGRQAIPIVWDFAEGVPMSDSSGGFSVFVDGICHALNKMAAAPRAGTVNQADATQSPLPNDAADLVFTDPPYYDAVPYSDLSDFFYVWHKRILGDRFGFSNLLTPKDEECIVDEVKGKDQAFFIRTMTKALAEARRYTKDDGLGVVVFAHKSTAGWEAQIQAMLDAGWTITASWPVDTECGSRLRAMNSAALASSVHLVCRPRQGSEIGDWRAVLAELPKRIHAWLPRLSQEGVVGADAVFACLGPALEIFSRYERVEKASGEAVPLSEYLVQVWAAVSREALALVLKGGDTAGFEEDARLTAMWLWTLQAGGEGGGDGEAVEEETEDEDDEDSPKKAGKLKGFSLEFDAARKIGQGLGCHLERLGSLVEIKGPVARLLSVDERAQHLWKVDKASLPKPEATPKRGRKAKDDPNQLSFFDLVPGDKPAPTPEVEKIIQKVELKAGQTTLDRLHQAMLLFGAGRGEALKRFLVDDGVGKDDRFWKLASALQPLYPPGTDERRWSEGVLARKKGLGF